MKIRQLTDADWPEFQNFCEQYFGFSHVSRRDFNEHWFKTPRHPGWAAMALEGDNGHIAGMMMFIVVPAWFDGKPTTMAWISSGAVEPDARRLGGGAPLYLWAYRTFPLVGAQSGNEFSNPINARLGNAIPGLGMRRFLRLLSPTVGEICAPEGREAALATLVAPVPAPGLHAVWTDAPPADYDPLWESFRARFAVTTDRTASYLVWRYVDNPIVTYRFLEIRRGKQLVALAVVRPQDTPAGTFHRVTDFAAKPQEDVAAFAAVIAACAESGAIACDFLVLGTGLDTALEQGGFRLADAGSDLEAVPNLLSPVDHRQWSNNFFIGGAHTAASEVWRNPDAIYFTKGDGDRDWPTGYDLQRLNEQG